MMEARVLAEVNPFAQADALYAQVKRNLEALPDARHEVVEETLRNQGRELMRTLFEAYLGQQGARRASAPVVDERGQEHREVREHERGLTTVFGDVRLVRFGYNRDGAGSLHPVDAALNLPQEQYSYGIRVEVVRQVVHLSYGVTGANIERITGVCVNRRQLEESVANCANDVDAFYERRRTRAIRCVLPDERIVVITADGKGVVMRKEHLREATRKAAEARTPRMLSRKSPGEKSNSKRMAQVVGVYDVDPYVRTAEQFLEALHPAPDGEKPERPKPHAKWLMASLVTDPETQMADAFREAHSRDPEHRLPWVVLVDGDRTQIRRIKKLARRLRVQVTIVCDVIHVAEYLWKAGTAFEDEATPGLETWVLEHLQRVLRGNASLVAAGIRRSATLREVSGVARKRVDRCADYLLRHAQYLHYDRYLAAGWPIATGVIEGGIRHLIRDRMDVTGARWGLYGAEAVLKLRATALNGDLDEYLAFHLDQEHARVHLSQYQDGSAPCLTPLRRAASRPARRSSPS